MSLILQRKTLRLGEVSNVPKVTALTDDKLVFRPKFVKIIESDYKQPPFRESPSVMMTIFPVH